MTREEFNKAVASYKAALAMQDAKKSTGSVGKLCEVILRDDILVKGISSVDDVRAKGANKADARIGHNIKVEIKTGCGSVAYAKAGTFFSTEDMIAENVLPDCNYVMWAPFIAQIANIHTLTIEQVKANTWVFTREAFIEALRKIGKNGLRSSLHITKQGKQMNIQTITAKVEDRLWEVLEGTMTYSEWKGR